MFDFSISSQVRRGGFSIAGGRPSRLNGSVKGVRIKTYPLCLSSSQKSPSWRLLHGAGRQAPKRKASAKADAFLFGRIRGFKTPGLFTVYLINSRPAIWPAALLRRKSGTASAAENAQGRLRYPHASKMPKEGPVNGSKPQNKMRLVETSRILFWQGVTIPNPGSIKALRRNGYKTRSHLSHRFSGLFHYKIMPEPIWQKQIGIKTYESASSPDGATFPSIISTTI